MSETKTETFGLQARRQGALAAEQQLWRSRFASLDDEFADTPAPAEVLPKIEARLREVLLEAAQDPAAREALSVFFRTTRFLPVDPASQQALDDLRRGVTRVREQLE